MKIIRGLTDQHECVGSICDQCGAQVRIDGGITGRHQADVVTVNLFYEVSFEGLGSLDRADLCPGCAAGFLEQIRLYLPIVRRIVEGDSARGFGRIYRYQCVDADSGDTLLMQSVFDEGRG